MRRHMWIIGLLMVWMSLRSSMLWAAATGEGTADPDMGLTKVLNIEEPWVENAVYVGANLNNDFSKGHQFDFWAEEEVHFNATWGLEIDTPEYLFQQPLNSKISDWGPISVGVKHNLLRFGTAKSTRAFLWTLEVEGTDWLHPSYTDFPGLGSSLTFETEGGIRLQNWMIQWDGGWIQALESAVDKVGFLNISLGCPLNNNVVFQVENDWSLSPRLGSSTWLNTDGFIPQIGINNIGSWFFALGESFGIDQISWKKATTSLLVESDI